jgi:hypothetical protein
MRKKKDKIERGKKGEIERKKRAKLRKKIKKRFTIHMNNEAPLNIPYLLIGKDNKT